jgi:hypothetical protein
LARLWLYVYIRLALLLKGCRNKGRTLRSFIFQFVAPGIVIELQFALGPLTKVGIILELFDCKITLDRKRRQ